MASVVVVVSYNDEEGGPSEQLPIEVARRVSPLFDGKRKVEVHVAKKSTALHILGTLADQRG